MAPDFPSKADNPGGRAIEREIRQERKFSLVAAIGQEAGDFLSGESPVPRLIQVRYAILNCLNRNLYDPAGALQAVLQGMVQSDEELCSQYPHEPLKALAALIQQQLQQEATLRELVRQVDMKWGEMYDERPHFERPGHPPHPDDEYTYASVRAQLTDVLAAIAEPTPEG